MNDRDELVVLMLAMTRREYAGLTSLQARRGEVSLLELVRSLVLQALLEESVDEVSRRRKEASDLAFNAAALERAQAFASERSHRSHGPYEDDK